MVRNKLNKLQEEIEHYLDLPYSKNVLKEGKVLKEKVLGGKGHWKDIKNEAEKIAQKEKIDLNSLTKEQKYNFYKKHQIGIDCSGLACQLLNFYFDCNLNPRRNSADMLTSRPLSRPIEATQLSTGDLIRQKNGHHVLFVVNKKNNVVNYVDSSFSGRGVKYGKIDLLDKDAKIQGFYRLFLLN
jgi:hypothetical protein